MSGRGFASVTNVLIILNVAVYVFMAAHGGPSDQNQYYLDGELYGRAVLQNGQWYRIVTGAFLHAGLAHIGLNMLALYQLGTVVEALIGGWRMLAVYAIALVGSGIAVVFIDTSIPTVGASGAIFGLFGALIAIGLRLGQRGRSLIAQMVPVLILNLVFTFAVPFISKSGHIGGLVSGFFAGFILFAMRPPPVAPVATVVDAATGEESEAEYLPPERPDSAEARF